jgi:hypothetical protein
MEKAALSQPKKQKVWFYTPVFVACGHCGTQVDTKGGKYSEGAYFETCDMCQVPMCHKCEDPDFEKETRSTVLAFFDCENALNRWDQPEAAGCCKPCLDKVPDCALCGNHIGDVNICYCEDQGSPCDTCGVVYHNECWEQLDHDPSMYDHIQRGDFCPLLRTRCLRCYHEKNYKDAVEVHVGNGLLAACQRLAFAKSLSNSKLAECTTLQILPRSADGGGDVHTLIAAQLQARDDKIVADVRAMKQIQINQRLVWPRNHANHANHEKQAAELASVEAQRCPLISKLDVLSSIGGYNMAEGWPVVAASTALEEKLREEIRVLKQQLADVQAV